MSEWRRWCCQREPGGKPADEELEETRPRNREQSTVVTVTAYGYRGAGAGVVWTAGSQTPTSTKTMPDAVVDLQMVSNISDLKLRCSSRKGGRCPGMSAPGCKASLLKTESSSFPAPPAVACDHSCSSLGGGRN